MKNFILASTVVLLTSFVFSSCSTSCNGSWYNNRNVQNSPSLHLDATELAAIEAFLDINIVQN